MWLVFPDPLPVGLCWIKTQSLVVGRNSDKAILDRFYQAIQAKRTLALHYHAFVEPVENYTWKKVWSVQQYTS